MDIFEESPSPRDSPALAFLGGNGNLKSLEKEGKRDKTTQGIHTSFKGAQTMKCTLSTEALEFWRLKVPTSRFALIHGSCATFAFNLRFMHLYQAALDTCLNGPLLCQPLSSRFALHGLRALERSKSQEIQGPLNGVGGFKRGGFPIWTCPSFFVLFGTFPIIPGFFHRFARGWSG